MKYSVLNLVPLYEGNHYKDAIDSMIHLARKVEELGYERYWIAEHHNMKSTASSATQLLIQHTLANTQTIKVGAGGIMLPNHSPYQVAEQFGFLETLYPNRVDLGIGRAPGTDGVTAEALYRRDDTISQFSKDIAELSGYFEDTNVVSAYPAAGLSVPFYILGSSVESAYLAAELGFPYAFASHFAPQMMEEAVAIYRENFKPSSQLQFPYVILGANISIAETDEEAQRLATSQIQAFLNIITGQEHAIQPPLESAEKIWRAFVVASDVPHFGPISFSMETIERNEKQVVEEMSRVSLIGNPQTVSKQINDLRDRVVFDELMVCSYIYDKEAQYKAYELLAQVLRED